MARNIRDLREIINISRLSLRDDEEVECIYSSDEEQQSLSSLDDYIASRPSSSIGARSSFTTLTSSTELANRLSSENKRGRPSTAPVREKRHIAGNAGGRVTVPMVDVKRAPFPNQYTPVPPIGQKEEKQRTRKSVRKEKMNFDHILEFLDSTVVNGWLEECNTCMKELSNFVNNAAGFVRFLEFFLKTMSFQHFCGLLDLEFSIITDRIKHGLHVGLSTQKIADNVIRQLTSAILPEYENAFKDPLKGVEEFIDVFVVISSAKTERYRVLLRKVNCTTQNKNYVQWILAMRAHGLISFLTGILRFYKEASYASTEPISKDTSISSGSSLSLREKWILWAVRENKLTTLDYLYRKQDGGCFNHVTDEKGRSLLFVAMESKSEEMVHYLCQLKPDLLKEQSPNGNSPLMFSINTGNLSMMNILLEKCEGEMDYANDQADGATALHLAVIIGSTKAVSMLLKAGCDKNVRMGKEANVTPLQLARELDHHEIVKLLQDKS